MEKTVEQKIHECVDKMVLKPFYIYENWNQANVSLDNIEHFPVVVNVLEESGTLRYGSLSINQVPEFAIAFIMPVNFDFEMNSELNEEDYDASRICKSMAIEFLDIVNKSGYFKSVDDVEYAVSYDFLDANLVAVILGFTAEETFGASLCGDMSEKLYTEKDYAFIEQLNHN